jgi:hypothetical protein
LGGGVKPVAPGVIRNGKPLAFQVAVKRKMVGIAKKKELHPIPPRPADEDKVLTHQLRELYSIEMRNG